MKKRGEELSLLALLVLIASAVVFGVLVYKGYSYGSQHEYYRIAVARDLALTIDSMYSVSGDVDYIYPSDVSGFGIKIKDNLVNVYDTNYNLLPSSYHFAGFASDKIDAAVEGAKFVRLEKTGNKIKITGVKE